MDSPPVGEWTGAMLHFGGTVCACSWVTQANGGLIKARRKSRCALIQTDNGVHFCLIF
jgi:hypothetical protein